MKKILVGAMIAVSALVVPVGATFADTATSTSAMEGHPHNYLAGNYDSIHNKGQWCLSNVYPFYRTIFYVADGTTNGADCNFARVFASMNYR